MKSPALRRLISAIYMMWERKQAVAHANAGLIDGGERVD